MQYDTPGFLPNARIHRGTPPPPMNAPADCPTVKPIKISFFVFLLAMGLATVEVMQAMHRTWSNSKVRVNGKTRQMQWRDMFDIAVKWRRWGLLQSSSSRYDTISQDHNAEWDKGKEGRVWYGSFIIKLQNDIFVSRCDQANLDRLPRSILCLRAGWVLGLVDESVSSPPPGLLIRTSRSCGWIRCLLEVWAEVSTITLISSGIDPAPKPAYRSLFHRNGWTYLFFPSRGQIINIRYLAYFDSILDFIKDRILVYHG